MAGLGRVPMPGPVTPQKAHELHDTSVSSQTQYFEMTPSTQSVPSGSGPQTASAAASPGSQESPGNDSIKAAAAKLAQNPMDRSAMVAAYSMLNSSSPGRNNGYVAPNASGLQGLQARSPRALQHPRAGPGTRRSLGSLTNAPPKVDPESFGRQPCMRKSSPSKGITSHSFATAASVPLNPRYPGLQTLQAPRSPGLQQRELLAGDHGEDCADDMDGVSTMSFRSEVPTERLFQLSRKNSAKKIQTTAEIEQQQIDEARQAQKELARVNELNVRRLSAISGQPLHSAGRTSSIRELTVPEEFVLSEPPSARRSRSQGMRDDETRQSSQAQTPLPVSSGYCSPTLTTRTASPMQTYREISDRAGRAPGVPPKVERALCWPQAPKLRTATRATLPRQRSTSADGQAKAQAQQDEKEATTQASTSRQPASWAAVSGAGSRVRSPQITRPSSPHTTRPSTPQKERPGAAKAPAAVAQQASDAKQKLLDDKDRRLQDHRAVQQASGSVFKPQDARGSLGRRQMTSPRQVISGFGSHTARPCLQ